MGARDSVAEEFPEYVRRIHQFKMENAHFKKLHDEFERVSKTIARSEARIDLISEVDEVNLRKERLRLKDEILRMLALPEDRS